jgi:hypothetical protein
VPWRAAGETFAAAAAIRVISAIALADLNGAARVAAIHIDPLRGCGGYGLLQGRRADVTG